MQASTSAPFTLVVNPALVVVSGASGQQTIAPDSLATVYGTNLTPTSQPATSLPLPTELGAVQISVFDANGQTLKAPLTFVSPGQVNFLLPASAKTGTTAFISLSNASKTLVGTASISDVAPAIFTADSSGGGAPIAVLVTAHGDGSQDSYPAYACNSSGCVTAALDVSSASDTNVLVLYATGIRNAPLPSVSALVDSVDVAVQYAGPQSVFPGLTRWSLQLPTSLAGRGEVVLRLTAAGIQANPVKLRFR